MSAEPSPGRNPLRPFLGVTAAVLVLLVVLGGVKSYRDLSQARQRVAALELEIRDAQARIAALEQRIHRLQDDPNTLERLAREDLGLVEPGDVVIVLPKEPDTAGATPPDEPKKPEK
ncbi:MAG: septum formation initiator family protein [Acidobacteria bacterium]|nr:septum formation initiator family protein [Acidobacteriota bacterium]